MNVDTGTEKHKTKSEDTGLEICEIESEDALLDDGETKPGIAGFFRTAPALEQLKTHRKEAVAGFLGLMLLAISQIILILQVLDTFPQIPDVDLLALALSFACAAIGFACIIYALVSAAEPLKTSVVLARLAALLLATLFITAVKSFALGHLARLLFAGDYTRFEMAKMGVDFASMLLGIVVVALSYSFLAALLRERKVEFKNFGKSFLTLLIWVSVFYIPTYIVATIFSPHTALATFNTSLVVAIFLAFISSLFPLWFLAVGLSFHEIDEGTDEEDAGEDTGAEYAEADKELDEQNTNIEPSGGKEMQDMTEEDN